MSRTTGIVGTTSPLMLIGTVYHDGGVGGVVFVGQSVITALLNIKGNMTGTDKDKNTRWNISVWDTRLPLRQEPVGEIGNSGHPVMEDGRNLELKIEGWLRSWE